MVEKCASHIPSRKAMILWLSMVVGALSLGPLAAPAQTLTTLYAFTGGADGGRPEAPPLRDKAGSLYGTTSLGGDLRCSPSAPGCGVVYKLSAKGTLRTLHTFTGFDDGGDPVAALIADSQGNLYGTTVGGGPPGLGEVFELSKPDGQFTITYNFTGTPDGANPTAPLIRDADGNFYGTTDEGGDFSCPIDNGLPCGTIFKIDMAGNETVLYSFRGGNDGVFPYGDLVRTRNGNLYGTTWTGGGNGCGGFGCGVVFRLDVNGREIVLHRFAGGTDGANPYAGLLEQARSLFGTTQAGGDLTCGLTSGCGTVFKLDPSGDFSVLHSFAGAPDGASPSWGSSLIHDSAGNLYGTTQFGGAFNCGTIFSLDGNGNETVL